MTDSAELAEVAAESGAKHVREYETGRVAFLFDSYQHFELSDAGLDGEIVRVTGGSDVEMDYCVAVYVKPDPQ